MSECCKRCEYDDRKAVGEDACPFSTLYWDFMARDKRYFKKNGRMSMMMAMLSKKNPSDLRAIRKRTSQIREAIAAEKAL